MKKISFILVFLTLVTRSWAASVSPVPVQNFIQTMGVNTHLGQDNYTVPTTETELSYLGINRVRDQVAIAALPLYLQLYNETGVKLTESVNPTPGTYSQILSFIQTNKKMFFYIEGPNEPDGAFPITWMGHTGSVATNLFGYQLAMDMSAICQQLSGPSLGFPANGGPVPGNFNDDHIYMQFLYPPFTTPSTLYPPNMAFLSATVPGKQPILTETGGWTVPMSTGWTQNVQGKYNLDSYFDAYLAGSVLENDLYELQDHACDPSGTDRELHFGQFNCDNTPKVAATMVHNTTTILADTGIKIPTSLTYTLSGMPMGGEQLLLQKSDGSWWLALWNDADIWDFVAFQEITVNPVSVIVNLGITASQINVYDPFIGTTVQQTASNANTITVSVPDHVIFVNIKP